MEAPRTAPLALAILLALHLAGRAPLLVWGAMDSCYDDDGGRPSRCMPKFENAAFNRSVLVSNACGAPPEDYCMQTGSTRLCHRCDAADPEHSHGARLLTDFHADQEPTWWQSQSMFYGVQHPNSVNITLHLGKEPGALCIEHAHTHTHTHIHTRVHTHTHFRACVMDTPCGRGGICACVQHLITSPAFTSYSLSLKKSLGKVSPLAKRNVFVIILFVTEGNLNPAIDLLVERGPSGKTLFRVEMLQSPQFLVLMRGFPRQSVTAFFALIHC